MVMHTACSTADRKFLLPVFVNFCTCLHALLCAPAGDTVYPRPLCTDGSETGAATKGGAAVYAELARAARWAHGVQEVIRAQKRLT